MSLPPNQLTDILIKGRDAQDSVALLEEAGCLSAVALRDRSAVIALIEEVTRKHVEERARYPLPFGIGSIDLVARALDAAGYLSERGLEYYRTLTLAGATRTTPSG